MISNVVQKKLKFDSPFKEALMLRVKCKKKTEQIYVNRNAVKKYKDQRKEVSFSYWNNIILTVIKLSQIFYFEIWTIVRPPLTISCFFVDLGSDLKSPTKGDFFFTSLNMQDSHWKTFLSLSIYQNLELA